MTNIRDIEQKYIDFSQSSMALGSQLAENISMLQLDEANEKVVQAVMEIEKLTNKQDKTFLQKLPILGRYVGKIESSITEEKLRNSNINEVVGRLFNSLNTKKENIISVMERLYTIKEHLKNDVEDMLVLEPEVTNVANKDENSMEVALAKNLLVQLKPSIIKARDRIGIIDTTCKAAQATTQSISALLPSLQGELITEMAIQGGLQELKEFKQLFDNTIETVRALTAENHASMGKVLEDVIDLSVTQSKDIALLENMDTERSKLRDRLISKQAEAKKIQAKQLETLERIQSNQKVLSYLGD